MITAKHARFFLGALAAVAVAAGAPGLASAAEAHGGGGGGAHFSGGGGGAHFSGGGGAHFAGGGHPSFAGAARPGFGAAPHAAFGGAAHAHYSASANRVYGGYAGGGHLVGRPTGGFTGAHAVRPGFVGHGGFVSGSGRFWGGGYWGGRFWPGVHYGAGFAWFLPVLPFGYATYYWGGNPYYYYDGGYYSWNPDYNGYVATDPPPVADSSGSDQPPPSDDGSQEQSYQQGYDVQPQTYAPPTANPNSVATPPPSAPPPATSISTSPGPRNFSGGVSDIIAYPRNGQNDQQTSTDKFECHKWSVAQTGFDPTRSMNLQGNAGDYRRAMTACMDARGYTVR